MSSAVVSIPVYDKSDPRAGEPPVVPFHLPRDWEEHNNWLATLSTTLAGAGMVIKNPLAAYVALNAGLLSLFNQKPLRQKKDSGTGGPWAGIAMSFGALLSAYIPRMIVPAAQVSAAAASATIAPGA